MEETISEAELLKDMQSQQSTKAAVAADRMETEFARSLLRVGRGGGEKEKRNVTTASPQNLPQVFPGQISKV